MLNYIKALLVAIKAHKGQRDKGGHWYIWHPIRVSLGVKGVSAKVVALLHDVLEDSDTTIEDLNFLSEDQRQALLLMTHDKSVDYSEYIKRIKGNCLARAVKISDLRQNMNLSRLKNVTEVDRTRNKKYLKALKLLTETV